MTTDTASGTYPIPQLVADLKKCAQAADERDSKTKKPFIVDVRH